MKARFVLLATGIVDESPDVPGLDEAVAKGSIRYCPVCDGYEAADQRIGVLGHGEDASSKARFLRTYSSDVTLLSLDERGSGNTETARSLREAGIKMAGPVRAIEHSADGMRAVVRGGKVLLFDVIYPALGCGVHPNWRPPWARRRTTSDALKWIAINARRWRNLCCRRRRV